MDAARAPKFVDKTEELTKSEVTKPGVDCTYITHKGILLISPKSVSGIQTTNTYITHTN